MATRHCKNTLFVFHVFILLFHFSCGRNHSVKLQDEVRQTVELSKFGFLQNGILSVNFTNMVAGGKTKVMFGFSLEKTGSDGISPYMEQHSEKCIFMDHSFDNANQISVALIKLDLRSGHESIIITKFGKDFLNLTIDNQPVLPELTTSATASSSAEPNAANSPTPSAETRTSTVSSSSNVAESTSSMASSSTVPESSSASALSSDTFKIETSSSSSSTSAASSSSRATKSNSSAASSSAAPKTAASSSSSNGEGSTSASSSSAPKSSSTLVSSSAQQGTTTASTTSNQEASTTVTVAATIAQRRRRRNADTNPVTLAKSEVKSLPLYSKKTNISEYSGNFVVKVKSKAEEGLYNLYFHNCPVSKAQSDPVPVAIQINIVEKNGDNYLSAGEEPLPFMFGVLSVLFFATAIYWLRILRNNRDFTYKVHYMMFVLILLKSLDLMFQAVNFHFISKDGKPAESWEVLYYITHLLKGALLFTTIVLIGTGYFFIKHVLSDRDKKIFLIVIPLQILANTAQIVMESTEEASKQYTTWKELFILVDLLCCGAILFPVVWSIRHLQEGSQTDGKAALNLAKLKLFRHFYVMIVCYIYFTRIIVYLIKITVPFQYMWLDDFFNNAASYVFFVLTGYKFRPAPDNPYLHVPQEETDDEVEMDEVVTNSGITDGVTRLQPSSNGKRIFETA